MRERLQFAIELARNAGAIAATAFADRPNGGGMAFARGINEQIERVLVTTLHHRFPRDAVYGEEFGSPIGDPLWVVDPIDGLVNFSRGSPYFCISIAVIMDGALRFGVVYDPLHDDMFVARVNLGAERNGQRIHCAADKALNDSCIYVGFAPRSDGRAYLSVVQRLAAARIEHRQMGAGALGLAHVADGRFDGYYEPHLHSWDALAGLLLVREAGANTNDFMRGRWLSRGNQVLATTPGLWEPLHGMLLDRSTQDAA